MIKDFDIFNGSLKELEDTKLLISTINAHSFNVTKEDQLFKDSLMNSDILIPDGISIVWALKWLSNKSIKKIAGADLFYYEMKRLQKKGGKCFFLGSTNQTLTKIKERALKEFPDIRVESYSPPYKAEFSKEDSYNMIQAVNEFNPDVLFIGLTAPKQEKWAYQHLEKLQTGHICCIGAVFDFYAGTIERAPDWMIDFGLEWFYRLAKEPRRMWRRYIIGNVRFIWYIFNEKYNK